MADISDWPNKEQAAKLTGIPVRTLERRISAGDIRREYRRMPNRKPMAVLHPDDLARLVADEGAGTAVMLSGPQQIAPIPPTINVPAPDHDPAETAPTSRQMLEVAFRRIGRSRYVTMPEAAQYIGLPEAYLRRLVHDGKLPAVKAAGWRVRTADLDRL